MGVIATDDFNRADSASLGANWTTGVGNNPPKIVSNKAVCSDDSDDVAYWTGNDFAIDQYSQATITLVGSYTGLVVRATATDYICGQNKPTADLEVVWYNAGAYTVIGTTYTTNGFSNNDVARLDADIYTIRFYQNGTLRVSGTNTGIPLTGDPGVNIVGGAADAASVDDWSGGNIYPIGVIARAVSGAKAAVSSVTQAITIPAGYSNVWLQVFTQTRDATDADRNITGVIYNTTETLTQHKEQNNDTYDLTSEQWGVANPTATTANVVVSFAGTVDVTSVVILALCDVAQTGQPDATNGATNTGNPSVAVTTTVVNCMVFDSVYTKDNNLTVDSSQIIIANYSVNGGGDYIGVSREYVAGTGATTMSWTIVNATEQYVTSGVSIKPFVSGTAIKTIEGLAKASVKTMEGLAIASMKVLQGLA